MTRYEKGFITKCAEYGIDGRAILNVSSGRDMTKKAYGVYDDYEYTDRVPVYIDPEDRPDVLKRLLRKRVKELKGIAGKPLYPGEGVDERIADMVNLSKYRYHEDPNSFNRSEIGLSDYEKLVNNAIAENNREKLRDAAEYWSMSARSSLDPYLRVTDTTGKEFDASPAFFGGLLGATAGFGKAFYDKVKYDRDTTGPKQLMNIGIGALGGAAALSSIYALKTMMKNKKKKKPAGQEY